MYFSFALAGHTGTCLRPLHIFALLCFLLLPSGECIGNFAAANPPSAVVLCGTKAGKFPPFLHKIFNDDPQFFARFR